MVLACVLPADDVAAGECGIEIEIARMMAAIVDQFCESYCGAPDLDHARH